MLTVLEQIGLYGSPIVFVRPIAHSFYYTGRQNCLLLYLIEDIDKTNPCKHVQDPAQDNISENVGPRKTIYYISSIWA